MLRKNGDLRPERAVVLTCAPPGSTAEAAAGADLEDRQDVGGVQASRGFGLAAEPLQSLAVAGHVAGEDLQRDATAQRDLLRFVDHPHPAPADLPEDAIVAQSPPIARD